MNATIRTLALAAAVTTGISTLAACGSSGAPAAATTTSTTPAAATTSASPTAPATAPDTPTCKAFADTYNSTVGPVLKGGGATGNVYLTEITDAFTALAGTLADATDPYSQTIAKDARAVAAAPTSYTALGTFNADLPAFLKQCGMS